MHPRQAGTASSPISTWSTALAWNPSGELAFGVSNAIPRLPRRGARVVDRDGLENRCTFTGTVSSNLTLSATYCLTHLIIEALFDWINASVIEPMRQPTKRGEIA